MKDEGVRRDEEVKTRDEGGARRDEVNEVQRMIVPSTVPLDIT